jgi:hypothetical protein
LILTPFILITPFIALPLTRWWPSSKQMTRNPSSGMSRRVRLSS